MLSDVLGQSRRFGCGDTVPAYVVECFQAEDVCQVSAATVMENDANTLRSKYRSKIPVYCEIQAKTHLYGRSTCRVGISDPSGAGT